MEILQGQAHLRGQLRSNGSPKDDADALRTYLNSRFSRMDDKVLNSNIALMREIADRIERGYK